MSGITIITNYMLFLWCIHVPKCVQMNTYVWGGTEVDVFGCCSPLCFLRQDLSLKLVFINGWPSLAGQWAQGVLFLGLLKPHARVTAIPGFLVGARDGTSSPHLCIVSTLPTELSPHPWYNFFLKSVFRILIRFICVHECFACIYVCVSCVYLDSLDWSYGWLWVPGEDSQYYVGSQPRSSALQPQHTSHVSSSSEECPQSIFWPRKALSRVRTLTLHRPTYCHLPFNFTLALFPRSVSLISGFNSLILRIIIHILYICR